MSNIIAFPKEKKNCPPQSVEEMQDRLAEKKIEYVNEIVDFYGSEMLVKISQDGFEIDDDNFMKDFAFTLESLRSGLYRSVGVEHPLQESVDEAIEISLSDINDDEDL